MGIKLTLILIILAIAGFLSYKYIFNTKKEDENKDDSIITEMEKTTTVIENPIIKEIPEPTTPIEPQIQEPKQEEPVNKPKPMKITCTPSKLTLSKLKNIKSKEFYVSAINVPEGETVKWSYKENHDNSYSYTYSYINYPSVVSLVKVSDDTNTAYFNIDTMDISYVPNSISITAKAKKQTRNTKLNIG